MDKIIAAEIRKRLSDDANSQEARTILAEEVPQAGRTKEIKISLAETRIALEEFVQKTDREELRSIERRYKEKIATFDQCVEAILKGGVVDGIHVIATDNDQVRAAIEELDEKHTEFQDKSDMMMRAHVEMINQAEAAERAMAKLDESGERAAELGTQVGGAAGQLDSRDFRLSLQVINA